MTVLAQAVSTPLICIFGGFEGKESFSGGSELFALAPHRADQSVRLLVAGLHVTTRLSTFPSRMRGSNNS